MCDSGIGSEAPHIIGATSIVKPKQWITSTANRGWGESGCTVVCMGNNTIINNNTRINSVCPRTHDYKPALAPPCVADRGSP